MNSLPKSLGELRRSQWSEEKVAQRSVRQELRENLLCKLEKGDELFPGVHGYDDTVLPQIINAILSRHHFILLGLRGQAKSRILRGLVGFHGRAHSGRSKAARFTTIPTRRFAAPAANAWPPKATPLPSHGSLASIATWKNSPRPTSPLRT